MNPVISNSRSTITRSIPAIPESSKNDLTLAIDEGQTEKVLAILKKGDLASRPLPNGQMPFNYAIRNQQLPLVEAMYKELKLDMGSKDCHGLTAIDHAMIGGNKKMISLVFGASLGQALDAAKAKMTTPIQDLEIDRFAGVIASLQSGKYFHTWPLPELHKAAREGDLAKVKKLLDPKDPNPYEPKGATPLHHAILAGKEDVALWLLQNGAKAELLTQGSGQSLLHLASLGGHANLIPTLVSKHKQNPNAADKSGKTPLHYAVVQENLSTAKALVQQGASLQTEGPNPSPLDILIEVARQRSNARDPLNIPALQWFMLMGIFSTWIQTQHYNLQDHPLMMGLAEVGVIARILTASFNLNSDKSSKSLDCARSRAAFWGSLAVRYLPLLLQQHPLISGNPAATTFITAVEAVSSAWRTYHVVKGACKGLSLSWQNRCYVEEVRPIPAALIHSVVAYNVFGDFMKDISSFL